MEALGDWRQKKRSQAPWPWDPFMQGPKTPLILIRKVEKRIVIDGWMKVNGEERARNRGG
jgi:hypothetical protein